MRLDAVLNAVGQASLSAAVMILAVLVLRVRFQDRTPRRAFCLLWDIVLVRLLVLGAVPSPVSIQKWLPAVGARVQSAAVSQPETVTALMESGPVMWEEWHPQTAYLTEDTLQMVSAGTAQAPAADWSVVLTALWLAAALLMAGGFLWSHLRSRKVYAASLPCRDGFVLDWLAVHPLRRPVQVRTSDRIAAPLTYGVLYPVILLPRGMGDGEVLPCVLAHEHEHIRRFDALRKMFLAAALCLHWFNPLAWVMYALCNRDIELACDEAVLRGGADRERYALALLSMEEQRGRWSPSGSHFSRNALEERIKAIMKRKHISMTALAAVLVVMSITTTVFASAAPEKKEDVQQDRNGAVATTYAESEKLDSLIMMYGGEDGGKLYSVDGGASWMSEERYHAEYGEWGDGWQVEWWTYDEYKAWLEQEKKDLQEMIGARGWTPSTGWFTWDQQKVDESIALYEEILENIKNGALYSKTILDKDGREVEDAMLGSDAPLDMVITSTFDDKDMVSAVPKSVDKAALLEELKAFGIGGNANLMTYNGQLIRYFVDGASVGSSGYSVQYVYTNPDGVVDVHTLRSVIHNPDGSYDTMGDLIGVAAEGDKGFDQELIDCAAFTGGVPQVTADGSGDPFQDQNSAAVQGGELVYDGESSIAVGSGGGRGKTFEEIFAQYEEYGLIYKPREGGMGAMTYNGLPVRSFADLKPDGSVFSYEDPYAQDGLTVRAEYGQDGGLTGLTADPAPLKDIDRSGRELSFDYRAPVQGNISAGFSQGKLRFHYGVDISAEKGADVTAFADGTVSETGFSADMGNYVVLTHADGYSTLYAHCLSIAVSEGDSVVMGQKIAVVGASGMATGPMLHFELRNGDTYLDPEQYLEMAV